MGPLIAAVFVAEIGDVTRFPRPTNLCSWAGLTPRHYESDTTVRRGHITKQGSRLVRWAAVEAVQRLPHNIKLRADRDRIARRRGTGIGKVAAARKLLTLVYYGLRDGHIRCLAKDAACDVSDAPGACSLCVRTPPCGEVVRLIEPARPPAATAPCRPPRRRDDRHPSPGLPTVHSAGHWS